MKSFLAPIVLLAFLASCDHATAVQGGAGGSTTVLTCPSWDIPPIGVKGSVEGSNGTFVDHCDAAGNLVTYRCHEKTIWDCNPEDDPECDPNGEEPTAIVEELVVDCAGTCSDGRCASRCPTSGDLVEYAGVQPDGTQIVKHVSAGWIYRCALPSYPCVLPPVGTKTTFDDDFTSELTCVGSEIVPIYFVNKVKGGDPGCNLLCTAEAP